MGKIKLKHGFLEFVIENHSEKTCMLVCFSLAFSLVPKTTAYFASYCLYRSCTLNDTRLMEERNCSLLLRVLLVIRFVLFQQITSFSEVNLDQTGWHLCCKYVDCNRFAFKALKKPV